MTIIPRGRALGVTLFLPEEDRYSYSKQRLESIDRQPVRRPHRRRADLRSRRRHHGRFERHRARDRCSRATWSPSGACRTSSGRSPIRKRAGEVFLGRQVTQHKQVSDETAHVIDEEVRRVIDTATTSAREHPRDQSRQADAMADALIKYETIDETADQGHHGRASAEAARRLGRFGRARRRRSAPEGEADGGPRSVRPPASTNSR